MRLNLLSNNAEFFVRKMTYYKTAIQTSAYVVLSTTGCPVENEKLKVLFFVFLFY